ncbi:MAG: pyruvate dehydrogenase complex dihydrolipoamide acetyltransferase [Alphaproteobacteria bacterium]|nr:pyruvate dehydrogenase complex dihydrolipoamide acetyltransferase [Alphaproteobacteria bacterium]OJV16354.1 MAG: pyruvate dehydrogenase complex dihydrolipoamide acetyltransferase [Alphaproteobacteria bacterium 33-17]
MPIEILMPALSPTMTEGNLAKWLKKEGDKIKAGEVIAEIETDKATMEVEAVDEGTLGKILIPAGTENVKVNELIALILEAGEDKASLDSYAGKSGGAAVTQAPKEEPKQASQAAAAAAPQAQSGDRAKASPLAKRVAQNEGVDLSGVQGTGPHGRIIKDDVMDAMKSGGSSKTASAPQSSVSFVGRNPEEYRKVPNNNMRKVIAKRLCESKQTVPHFYLNIECKIDKLLSFRQDINSVTDSENKPVYKVSVNDIVIKAVAMSLRDVPEANSTWTDEATLLYNNVDVSVAVAIDGGLITPIIKNADQKTITSISSEMKDLAKRARDNKLAPHEFQGGGFSISNLGMYGIKNFNAIINPPQTCILAIGTSTERPVVKNGQIQIANIMEVTLSSDHRVVDGTVGAKFLASFKKYIENPVLMLV